MISPQGSGRGIELGPRRSGDPDDPAPGLWNWDLAGI